jgi:excisionase family DNA binding protein
MVDLEAALERIVRRVVREEVRAAVQELAPQLGGGEFVDLKTCGVERDTVRAAIKRGALQGHKVGRKLVVRRDELARWVESHRSVTADASTGDELDRALAQGRLRAVPGGRR